MKPGPDPKDARQSNAREQAEAAQSRLAAIVESSDDAIISQDLNGIITSWNKGAEKIFGYTAAEMVGTPIMRLIPADRRDEENFILGKIRYGEKVEPFETLRQTKDGQKIHVSVTASPITDRHGNIIGTSKMVRDLTRQKQQEHEFARITRLYAVLSQVNQAIVLTPARDELFQKICHILVEPGGFHMAWIGWHNPETRQIDPVAVEGDEQGYIRRIKIYADDRPEGRGPTGLAFRSGEPCVCNDMLNDPVTLPWREELARRGLNASAVFPIRLKNDVCATLTVYSDEPGFFQDKEIALLAKAAEDISFALDNFREKEELRKAEQLAENERFFSATMIESMPGIVYFYDAQGRFLRWNKNFEIVSGYSGEEIARMHPLDFFSDEDKDLLQQRIAEVFAKGDSFIEAPFVSKDGRATPYFFTGRRVMFDGRACLVGMGVDISERKRAEMELREVQERLEVVVENLREGLIISNADGKLIRWNAAANKMYDHAAASEAHVRLEELTGVFELSTLDGTVLAPDHWPFSRVLRGETLAGLELQIRRRTGVWERIFSYAGDRVAYAGNRTLAFLTIQDITERKQSEAALRASEDRYRTLFERAPDGIVIADTKGYYLDGNSSICRMLGYAHEELVRLHSSDIVVPEEIEKIAPALEAIQSRPDYHREWQFRRKDGSVFPAEVIATMMPDGNIMAMIRDITERKRTEQALRVLNQTLELEVAARTGDLQAALVRAEAADRIKSAFLATMSHELRTPLNSIIGFTGIMLQGLAGPLTAEQTKQLGMVRSSSRHLLELINDVLDLSKIEAGQLEVRAEPFNLRESVERVAGLVRPMAEKKNLKLSIVAPPDLGEMTSDRRRVEQILLNLVNNAVKFTEQGGVTITVEELAAGQTSTEAPSRPGVRIRVTDTGIGIKPEDLARLFQPFHQIDSGLTRQHEGTGLGLVICRRLATLLGGEISATSEWAKGSEFTVILPRQTPNAA